ncbi:nuclear transport factor 2 family protein [Amycolatopsis sp. YIM 10]|uniref:nuclear transport factor 2 family protein n=1 Tax=Amycolatopsis sp. YIM 10 TaxID=2653857 RepID=UPI00129043C3|nr:nuclear transport factor 2 family protein [Amycolatopsis sp. YIM 10]QFU92489.1 Steroid Delta-isomerase [Amycolatopsis sp. YIM 10]
MPTPEVIADRVRQYLSAVESGTAAEIASCYTEDATVEDPVGTESHRGREAIVRFYSAIENARRKTELITLRVAGSSAAFHFRARMELADGATEIDPIDIMTFDEDGRITGMRAFWSQPDLRAGR